MKIEDEVRDALRDRAEGVSASVDQAWSKLNAPHAAPSGGKRVAAALVARVHHRQQRLAMPDLHLRDVRCIVDR